VGLLDSTIRQTVHSALSPLLMDLSYTGPSSGGSYSTGAWTGTTVATAQTCKGWIEQDVSRLIPNPADRKSNHRVVGITQLSLDVTPVAGGQVTARSETLAVLRVEQDPASATWLLLAEV
jgi:hypothetical protein